MKAIKQRFYKEIVRKYKENYFATARKQLSQQQEFRLSYERILESGDDLISLADKWGYIIFFKHIPQTIDERLYQKLYHHNTEYFLKNLNFIQHLIQLEILPVQHIDILVSALAQVVQESDQISWHNTSEIFFIVEKILTSHKYLNSALEPISNYQLLPRLYSLTIQKEANQYFFTLLKFCKLIGNQNVARMSDQQKLHCLQIHILTSTVVEELGFSYSALNEIFQKYSKPDQELYEYGSILDKTMKDIAIHRLIDPISFFLVRAFNNQSLKKLSIEMGYVQVIFDAIVDHLMTTTSVSIFGHHSMWSIFRKIILYLMKTKNTQLLAKLDWRRFKEKLSQYKGTSYPYIKNQLDLLLQDLSRTNEKNILAHLLPSLEKHIIQQLQQVQI